MSAAGAKRRKVAALVLSGAFPGLGQFYNRQPIKGVLFVAVGGMLSWVLSRIIPTNPIALSQQEATSLVLPGLILSARWVWSVVDGWRGAGRLFPRATALHSDGIGP